MGIGVIALGVFVGWIARIFVTRLQSYTVGVFSALIAVVLGGTILSLFRDNFEDLFWYYPIGLVIGFFLGVIFDRTLRLVRGK